jgi:NAD(P)H-flavin reductase
MVTRVEVSLDDGKSWTLCNIRRDERSNAFGKFWCWVLWSIEVDMMKLASAKELVVRAWDNSMNTQPDNITWNLMGVMNNSWYRVRVDPDRTSKQEAVAMRCRHPVVPGDACSGWMVHDGPEAVSVQCETTASMCPPLRTNGSSVDRAANSQVPAAAVRIEHKNTTCPLPNVSASPPKALSNKAVSVRLTQKEWLSHDVISMKFALPDPCSVLGLAIGKHVLVSARVGSAKKMVARAYTPTSSDEDVGEITLLVKVYPQGVLSQHFVSLSPGDCVQVKGPLGSWEYLGRGNFLEKKTLHCVRHFGLLAAGSGLTPVLQVIYAVLRNPDDSTTLSLLFSNKTEEDILLRTELDALALEHSSRLRVWHTISRPGPELENWAFDTGRVTQQMIEQHLHLPEPTEGYVLICGPQAFIDGACLPSLDALGYTAEYRHVF